MQKPPVQFEIHPSSGMPIYRQIIDQVTAMVASGQLKPADSLPSVRQMASDLQINMMTVSKAYGRLEADKILQRVRGKGMIVASQTPSGTVQERRAELRPQAESLVTRGHQLGLTNEQIVAVVKSILKERRS